MVQYVTGDWVVADVENAASQSRDLGFRRMLDPCDQVVGLIQGESSEDGLSEAFELLGPVKLKNDFFQRAQGDVVTASPITEQVAPTANFRDTVPGSAVTARTGAAQDEHLA